VVNATVDEKYGDLVRSVRACLVEEERLEIELAASRANTGEALMRLEEHCKSLGVNHSEMITELRADADIIAVERLTEVSIRNRKRLARMKKKYPEDYLPFILPLKVGQQRSMMALTPERVGEFIALGCPVPGGAVPLKKATRREVANAVKQAEATIADELVVMEAKPAEERPTKGAFWYVVQALGDVDSLSPEELEQLITLMMPLLAMALRKFRLTTDRKALKLEIGLLKENVPVMEALKVLDALPPWLKNVDFGKLDPREMRDIACALLARIFLAIAWWYAPSLKETA
jgi:hypothetical protein